jgi:DNA-binding beta-propeller fold protein YncE
MGAAILILCALFVAADQKSASKKEGPGLPGEPPPDLIWPLPPDPPRIRWLAQYADLARVKKPGVRKSTWMEKLTGTKAPDERIELKKPYGITADRHGKIYVADPELKTVFVIDAANHNVEQRASNSRAPLALPVGVAVDAEDRLYVSDADLHSIICFNASGAATAVFGTTALARPGGLALDQGRNRLYVADAKASRLAVFDTNSHKLTGYFGAPNKNGLRENGTFFGPTNIAVDGKGMLYVADTMNYRVQILDPEGKFVRAFGAQGDRPGEFIRPKGIGVDSEGHIYVADAEFNNFQIFTPEGQPLLAVGSLGNDPGRFALLAGLYVDPEDRIYTTEMFPGRVQVFQYLSQSRRDKGVRAADNSH